MNNIKRKAVQSRVGRNNVNKITDARQKLMQKRKVIDARERIEQRACQMDARLKLNKNKNANSSQSIASRVGNQGLKTVKGNRNLSLNKRNFRGIGQQQKPMVSLKRTIPGNPQSKGLQAVSLTRKINNPQTNTDLNGIQQHQLKSKQERKYPLSKPNVITIKNQFANNSRPAQRAPLKVTMNQANAQPKFNSTRNFPSNRSKDFQQHRGKELSRSLTINPLLLKDSPRNMNVWSPKPLFHEMKSNPMSMNRSSKFKSNAASDYMSRNDYMEERWDSYSRRNLDEYSPINSGRKRSRPINEDYLPSNPRKFINLDAMDRLDNQGKSNSGYKLLVSNLHPSVNSEDVRELFHSIGPLHSSRMIHQGLAEVNYVNEKHALRAIDYYHLRVLDGQPMNVEFGEEIIESSREDYYGSNSRRPISSSSVSRYVSGGGGSFYDDEPEVYRPSSSSNFPRMRHQNHYDTSPNVSAIHHALFSERHIPMHGDLPRAMSRGSMKYGSPRRSRY